jgi:uncharacterized protein YjbI with pentapeptide repeats
MGDQINLIKENIKDYINENNENLVIIENDLKKIELIEEIIKNKAAKKIQRTFKKFKERKQQKKASTKISKAYREKLSLVILNKQIGDILCNEIKGGNEKYRQDIKNLLNQNKTPKKLSNMYFYYCKFGKKILGYYEKAKDPKLKSIIEEIIGCVFVNTSFRSTNFNNIKFENTRFLNISNIKISTNNYYNFLQRNNAYKSIKKTHKTDDILEFDNAEFIGSTFKYCIFININFVNNSFGLNENLDPVFNNCKFINGRISFPLVFNNTKKPVDIQNIKHSKLIQYPIIREILKIGKNGEYIYVNGLQKFIPNIIFENSYFLNIDFISKEDFRDEGYLYKNCIFNKAQFMNINFIKNNFVDCTFNNVKFYNCKSFSLYFLNCKFYNCHFIKSDFGNQGITEFNNCKIIGCEFQGGIWHNWLNPICTTIIDSNTKINECIFIRLPLISFKFNNNSDDDSKQDNKIMDMRKNDFVCCHMLGTNFDNCNLEGSKFSARTTCISYFNWFGSIYKINPTKPKFGNNINEEFKKLCGSEENFDKFLLEFQGIKKQNKLDRLGIQQYLRMRYNEYNSLNIDVNKLRAKTNINPYDYIEVPMHGFYQIVPSTSMFNSNIKNCNFQSIDGFQSFDFTQVMKNEKGNPDLTATNLTHVRLENANFYGCNLIGTVFQVADIKGADFRNTIVNNNTDFENTMNTELVPYQKEENDRNGVLVRRYVEGSENTDTNRELEFSRLQQQANETHARSEHIINNRDKFFDFLNDIKLDENLKNNDNDNDEEIKKFLDICLDYSNKIIQNKTLDVNNKNYIKDNFVNKLCDYISIKLHFTDNEKNNLENSLRRIFSDAFLELLVSYKPPGWCWLQLVTLSLKFLISNTEMYIFMFIQYYFNEVFNAHGQGSESCTLGMVERLVLNHSQTSEGYLMTLKMDSDELKSLSDNTINSIKKYNPANESVKDSKIDKEFINKFNNPDNVQYYHHKYTYNKLINILKPNSQLPENKNEDLGFDFDYNISKEMRDECSKYIKDKIDKEEISTIDQICEVFVKHMQTLIIRNNDVSDEKRSNYEKDENFKKLFKKKLDAIKEHLEKTEIEFLKMDIVIMCGEEFTLEDISKYFDPDLEQMGGLKHKKNKLSRKAKGHSAPIRNNSLTTKTLRRTKSEPIFRNKKNIYSLDKVIIKKLKELDDDKFKKIFNKYINNKPIRKVKSLTMDNRRKLSSNNKVTRKAKSLTLDSKVKVDLELPITKYQEISLKNMNIQDKPYKNAIKKYYLEMMDNYVKKIETMSISNNIEYKMNYEKKPKSKSKSKSKSSTSPDNVIKLELNL